ncbi:MAG: molybdopterin-dependent oxidoreductase [Myxococcales bacterium]|nr:molybdopterin-dependent oxidoreductase [Myxococcales bacterium]MDH3483975.1 molybdopterin-dependent oxidoreductase [Myxococcales bacterium]
MAGSWEKTACILCECNCGLEVQLGGEGGRHFTRIRGDKAHPASQGYACEKPHRLDYYQNGPDRVTSPLRRKPDGTFEEIDWDTAIREVAQRLSAVRDQHGGDTIFYYGGGGQGNHLPAAYSAATRRAMGSRYRSNALAQEKTGEFWVNGRLMGTAVRGDFEHCEVALFVGKNPWQSHSIPRARVTLKAIAKDPKRAMIVIDPRRTETAELADIHLQVKPGTDAWLLAALGAVLVEEDLIASRWLEEHVDDHEPVLAALGEVPISEYCERSGVPEALVREAARRIGKAESLAVFEDLGIQMNRHSTLSSYLNKLLWLLTGNFGKKGAQYVPAPLVSLAGGLEKIAGPSPKDKVTPVVGARVISGLVPCNVIADEILTDHPKRYRAMIVESANPAHSLADSRRMREALSTLDTLVVIDIAMTETARLADYVLPTPTQYEKAEATFFNFEFPENYFHLRHPLFDPPDGVLSEPEIHARLCEALGAYTEEDLAPLHEAAAQSREAFIPVFFGTVLTNPKLAPYAPVILYRTLGPRLPKGLEPGAVVWGLAHRFAAAYPDSLRRAGFEGKGFEAPERLFDAILESPSGIVYSVDGYDESWKRIKTAGGKFHAAIPELLDALGSLRTQEAGTGDDAFPFVLSAGERRSFTANTILRNPAWRKKDAQGSLRMSPNDAVQLGVTDGDRVRLTTKRASVEVPVEVSGMMQPGHVSLPNGLGLDHPDDGGERVQTGIAPNELTASEDRDWLAGTPWHKHVPARIEAVQ